MFIIVEKPEKFPGDILSTFHPRRTRISQTNDREICEIKNLCLLLRLKATDSDEKFETSMSNNIKITLK